MSLLVDAVTGWLTEALGDASVRTGIRLVLGSNEERQLRRALQMAIDRTVEQAPQDSQESLRRALGEKVPATVNMPTGRQGTLADELRAAVRAEIGPLTDPGITGLGHSFCTEVGISPGWLLRVLPEEVVRAVTSMAATRGGTLAPLANQLNADAILAAIHQLMTENKAFSAVRSLPSDVSAFTGRESEMRKIRATATATSGMPVLTITAIDGMAGVGKTAIAIHAAHELAAKFPDGQVLLDLQGFTPGQRPLRTEVALEGLLRLIGVTPQEIPPSLSSRSMLWRARLAEKRLLIVLDNAATTSQVKPLIPDAPGSLVLVTSRKRLGPLGNAVSLDVLLPHEAAELFRRLTDPRQVAGQSEVVSRLTGACGNLPLALVLLAGRLRHHPSWSVAHLEQELRRERYRIEAMHGDDVSIRAAFGLSYAGLLEEEKEIFRILGIYPGPEITPAIAASLAGKPVNEAVATLESLFMHNLLQEISPQRYRMHDLLHEYALLVAQESSSSEALTLAMERVLEMYISVADNLGRSLSPSELSSADTVGQWVKLERTNLLACIDYAVKHDYREQVYALSGIIDSHLSYVGYSEDKLIAQRAVVSIARRHEDHRREARALLDMAGLEASTDLYDHALGHFAQARDIYADLDDRANEAECLRGIGIVGYLTGKFQAALQAYEHVMAIQQELGSELGIAAARVNIAGAQYMLGRLEQALENYNAALSTYSSLGRRGDVAQALLGIAIVRGLMGQPEQSLNAYYEVLAIRESVGGRLATAETHAGIAGMESSLGNYQEAITHYSIALEINRETGGLLGEAQTLLGLADTKSAMGELCEAEEYYKLAQPIYRKLNNRGGQAHTIRGLANILFKSGQTDDALDNFYEARAIFHDLDELPSEIETLRQIAGAELALGRRSRAVNALSMARDMTAQSNPAGTVEIETELAKIKKV